MDDTLEQRWLMTEPIESEMGEELGLGAKQFGFYKVAVRKGRRTLWVEVQLKMIATRN